MKRTETMNDDFSTGRIESAPAMDADEWTVSYEDLSNMMSEAVIMLDFQREQFHYMPNHDLSLCGYKQRKPQRLSFESFKDVIHPDDIAL